MCRVYKGLCVCVHMCFCHTHSLKGLEEAVEEEVPDDFVVFKRGHVPNEEIGKHSQRGWAHDPADGYKEQTTWVDGQREPTSA